MLALYTDGVTEAPLRAALEEAARQGPVKMVYLETPANPTNAMIDLALVRATVGAWAATLEATCPYQCAGPFTVMLTATGS